MARFDEAQHPRGHAGQFTEKANTRPTRSLDPSTGPSDGPAEDVTGLREAFGNRLRTDADLLRAIEAMEDQGIDYRTYNPTPEQIARIAVDAIRAERWRDQKQPGALDQHSLDDIGVMGGDEIRDLTPRQRAHMHQKAVEAAHRLEDYMVELGEREPDGRADVARGEQR